MIEITYTTGWFLTDEITCKHYITECGSLSVKPEVLIKKTSKKPSIVRRNSTDNKD